MAPPVIAENRIQLITLIATNLFGQNTPAIAVTEAEYGEMWAQDAVAMYGYAASAAVATETLTPFEEAPEIANAGGLVEQTAAVEEAEKVCYSLTDASQYDGCGILVVGGGDLWNVHVHADDVGAVIQAGIEAGRPRNIALSPNGRRTDSWLRPVRDVQLVTAA